MKFKLFILSSIIVLAGCSEDSNLQAWMNSTRLEAKKKIRPAQPPEPMPVVTYFTPQLTGPDAFSVGKLRAAFQNGNAPDLNRPKELLENFSLENLELVGTIGTSDNLSGLIRVDKHIYTVKVGNHLGQNFGRISKITTDKIEIIEVVEDAQGNWVNRPAELLLSNSNNNSKN